MHEEKEREKNVIAVTRSCRFHITSKPTAWRGICCSSVLKSSTFKFSDKKIIQIVVTQRIILFVSKKSGSRFLHNLKTCNKPFATDQLYSHQCVPFVVLHFQNPKL